MTPGYVQLKVIVNKALPARVTGQYSPREHSSVHLPNKPWAIEFLFRWQGQLLQGKPTAAWLHSAFDNHHLISLFQSHNDTWSHHLHFIEDEIEAEKSQICLVSHSPVSSKNKIQTQACLFSPSQAITSPEGISKQWGIIDPPCQINGVFREGLKKKGTKCMSNIKNSIALSYLRILPCNLANTGW